MSKNRFQAGIALAGLALLPSLLGAATVVIVNGDLAGVGFNDPTPASPVGGNTGTTLGQQRLIAFQAAANKWGATLTSSVTIRVKANWSTTMTCTSFSAVLGFAGPTNGYRDFAGAPVGGHWYPKALVNAIVGFDMNPAIEDINATFNARLGQTGCLDGHPFYLGLDASHGSAVDLIVVLTHELGHGLGFLTFTDGQTGAQAAGFPSIWDDFLLDNTTNKTWTMMTNSERAASALNTSHLVWNGGNVSAAIPQVLQVQGSSFTGADAQGRGRMYAPGTFSSGSSVSHFDTAMFPNQLMEPSINGDLTHEVTPPQDLTFSLLKDIGWTAGSGGTPDLTIAKSHTGNFTQGQTGATYSITVTNSGAGPTNGSLVTVTEILPAGLTATSISGTNWSCTQPAGPCTRSSVLNARASYPVITLTVNVSPSALASVTNNVSVAGGGETNTGNDSASNPTTINPAGVPDLTIAKSHTGNFTQGQIGATYTITVTNSGTAATNGSLVTMTEFLPAGLTATAIGGTNWSCTQPAGPCTRSDVLNAGASYPAITLTVNVSPTALASITNNVTVGGGGETNTGNNSASNPTTVVVSGSGNVALNKPATQSSTYAPAQTAGKAVDGNTDGVFFNGAVSSTNSDANAWWQVDLGASATVSSVVIWNRTDCCQNRLGDYWVFISDTPFGPGDTPATLQNRAGTWSSHQTVVPTPSSTIPVPSAPGRYVRVQLSGTDYLTIVNAR